MLDTIPTAIVRNNLTPILDEIMRSYLRLTGSGAIYGLIVVDQDAKVLAVNSKFDTRMNYWDLGAIGAALYGISKQGSDFFGANQLERSALVYDNMQFFVQSIGNVSIDDDTVRELICVVIGDKRINIGAIMLQMRRFAPQIHKQILVDMESRDVIRMTETELREHINLMKKQIFGASSNPVSLA
jgi:predicted regulator of Ras-like GTPase activity (Roadblock/LC7/MglB family)